MYNELSKFSQCLVLLPRRKYFIVESNVKFEFNLGPMSNTCRVFESRDLHNIMFCSRIFDSRVKYKITGYNNICVRLKFHYRV